MHYEVEVCTEAGEWLSTCTRYRLLGDASLKAVHADDRGCRARVVRVARDGSREVVAERPLARPRHRVRPPIQGGGYRTLAPARFGPRSPM